MPPQVILNPATTLSTASCKVYTCLDATESGIKLLIAGDPLEKGTKVELEIGGARNPRSFQPSENIVVNSLDTDGKTLIDTGYSLQSKM